MRARTLFRAPDGNARQAFSPPAKKTPLFAQAKRGKSVHGKLEKAANSRLVEFSPKLRAQAKRFSAQNAQ